MLLKNLLFFRKLAFPDSLFKPKHHYLLHYRQLIQQFGPLGKVWTLDLKISIKFSKESQTIDD